MIADLQNQLGIDKTFFIELVLFVSLYLWLSAVLFAPFLDLQRRRRGGTDGLKKEAAAISLVAAQKETERANVLHVARKAAAQERESALVDARRKAAELVASAKVIARAGVAEARDAASRRASNELDQLRPSVAPLSEIMVGRLTEKKVGV